VIRTALCACALLLSTVSLLSQDLTRSKVYVNMLAPEITPIERGHPSTIELQFRVARGFHINSNRPKQQYLKKTELKLTAPTDIIIGKINYPNGVDRSFPFAPNDKLNVYAGDFAVDVTVRPLSSVLPQKYAVHGFLKYQACDNAACYPPRQQPVSFEVRVTKDHSIPPRKNPAQSPHAHS
jgi:hypothetical protein